MLSITDNLGLYREPLGFAQANTEVLALSEAIIPAFAIETVCCSITWEIRVNLAQTIKRNTGTKMMNLKLKINGMQFFRLNPKG